MIFASRSTPALLSRITTLLVAGVLAFAPALASAKARPHPSRPATAKDHGTYKGDIVMDAATGNILIQDHADEISPPASMTKLMTYAVLYDKLSSGALTLDTPVKIDRSDSRMGGTQVYLDPRETFPVEDLIYAMMIQSANDAAHALARAAGGSVEAFVDLMNTKARELGMTHSTFRSPHGLPPSDRRIADGDLTTPHDYALLCRYLLLHTDILKYTSVRERKFGLNRTQGAMVMKNHNNLLGRVTGVDGLKTGYTATAGYCLSATGERNGHRVIVVIMGCFGPGGERDLGRSRDLRAIELMERGFSMLPPGDPSFDSIREKYVKPAVIPLQPVPDSSASPSAPNTPGTNSRGPTIKFSLPGQ
ncbi:MAG TPA: D-alanyl-D-alanine carboxypeptidase family protein [Opitutaceae bacterium]|nr:D-alanyl-D-alanine carboxypeptidase family protein [Opitutaceae bacterium]